MPLKVNVGLGRKVGEPNYGSRGATVNVEMELESSLVSDAARLRERIRQLFDVVRTSLTEELNGGNGNHASANSENGHRTGNGQHNGDGHAPGNGKSQPAARPATTSQVRAIKAIANSQRLDLALVLQNRFQATRPEDLSIRQASELIDSLKASSGR